MLPGKRALWFFLRNDLDGEHDTASIEDFAVVVEILGNKEDRCKYLGQDGMNMRYSPPSDVICVIVVNDFGLCNRNTHEDMNGGYLAIVQDNALKLIGIYTNQVSGAAKTCHEARSHPGYFTRIDRHLSWITEKIKPGECGSGSPMGPTPSPPMTRPPPPPPPPPRPRPPPPPPPPAPAPNPGLISQFPSFFRTCTLKQMKVNLFLQNVD